MRGRHEQDQGEEASFTVIDRRTKPAKFIGTYTSLEAAKRAVCRLR